ncbi:MAG: hypothetical protein ABJB16_04120, partial [Saprospiraceae bacterium]
MSFVKYMLIIILLSSLQIMSKAQSGIQGCYGFDCRQKKWSASFFTGYNLVGPGQSLKDRIMKTAFGDTQTGYATAAGPADPVKYPKHTESSPWNIELRYKVSKRISFGLDAGQLSKNKIEAYAHLFTIPNEVDGEYEVGNYLTLKSDLKAVSLLYIRKLNFVDDEISIGPALALSGIHDADTKGTVNNPTVIKPGIQVGYAIEFVKTKSF